MTDQIVKAARGAAFGSEHFLKAVSSRSDTMQNPFDPRSTAFLTEDRSDVMANVELRDYTRLMSDQRPTIYLNISVPEKNRGQGFATQILQQLMDLAKQTGVELRGTPQAFGSGSKMTTEQLLAWYLRLGFVEIDGDVVYRP